MKYEDRVRKELVERFHTYFLPSTWWKYGKVGDPERVYYAQIDGLVINDRKRLVTIIEVKHSHTADAYFQLENLYVPLMAKWLERSNYGIATCEVVKWYDPATRCPRPPVLRELITDVKPNEFAVHMIF